MIKLKLKVGFSIQKLELIFILYFRIDKSKSQFSSSKTISAEVLSYFGISRNQSRHFEKMLAVYDNFTL